MRSLVPGVSFLVALGCAASPPGPSALDVRHDACASCRMLVSDARTASQIVGPGEEPLFFDDLACLRQYRAEYRVAADALVYVADHRTGEWVPAADAVYTRTRLQTAMNGGVIAHASTASRAQDATATNGEVVTYESVAGAGR